jgi:hypothetical protein
MARRFDLDSNGARTLMLPQGWDPVAILARDIEETGIADAIVRLLVVQGKAEHATEGSKLHCCES